MNLSWSCNGVGCPVVQGSCEHLLTSILVYSCNIVLPVQQVLQVKAQYEGVKSAHGDSGLPEYEIIEDDDCDAWKITTFLNFLKYVNSLCPLTAIMLSEGLLT
jgi:hypothetical protein